MRRVGTAVAAIALAFLTLGLAMLPVLSPAFTRTYSHRFVAGPAVSLPLPERLSLAEKVRAFVAGGTRLEFVHGEGAGLFSEDEVSHLEDVRTVIAAARYATLALLLAAAVWAGLRWRSASGRRAVGRGLVAGAALLAGTLLAAGLAGAVDFDALFSAFHGVFFAEGTWTFPADSMLIGLFPYEFWVTAAAWWAGSAMALAFAALATGLALVRRHSANA